MSCDNFYKFLQSQKSYLLENSDNVDDFKYKKVFYQLVDTLMESHNAECADMGDFTQMTGHSIDIMFNRKTGLHILTNYNDIESGVWYKFDIAK